MTTSVPRSRHSSVPFDELRERDGFQVRIIYSARRKKTVHARLVDWQTLEVRAPAHIQAAELDRVIDDLLPRLVKRRHRSQALPNDDDLEKRAQRCNQAYFEGRLAWSNIRFVPNQHARFGSCTPLAGTIRISDRLRRAPDFVLDYIVVHELAHLVEANHSRRFWDLVYRYDKAERARGYLMALSMESDLLEQRQNDDASGGEPEERVSDREAE